MIPKLNVSSNKPYDHHNFYAADITILKFLYKNDLELSDSHD